MAVQGVTLLELWVKIFLIYCPDRELSIVGELLVAEMENEYLERRKKVQDLWVTIDNGKKEEDTSHRNSYLSDCISHQTVQKCGWRHRERLNNERSAI